MAMRVTYTVIDGEIVSENRGGVERDYLPDPQGNVVALLDSTQTKTDTWSYWPYGEVKARTGTTPTPFQYIGTRGYYQDSSTKTYVRARYLDTQKGRWMTEDPIGFDGGSWNLYRYAKCSPVTSVDVSGKMDGCPGESKQVSCYGCKVNPKNNCFRACNPNKDAPGVPLYEGICAIRPSKDGPGLVLKARLQKYVIVAVADLIPNGTVPSFGDAWYVTPGQAMTAWKYFLMCWTMGRRITRSVGPNSCKYLVKIPIQSSA